MVLDGKILLGLVCIWWGMALVQVNPHSNEVPPGALKVQKIDSEPLEDQKNMNLVQE
jgi:hypothetical protein